MPYTLSLLLCLAWQADALLPKVTFAHLFHAEVSKAIAYLFYLYKHYVTI